MAYISMSHVQTAETSNGKLNFLFLLVDDLGWADIGVNGSRYHLTPHIDKLAAGGINFTQAYAAGSVCSPTRASIMTGRHPVRVNITDWIPGRRATPSMNPRFQHIDDLNQLPLNEVTIAEVLKDHNYSTFFAGKWHLGGEGFLPTDQGFDHNIGGFSKGSPPGGYYAPWTNPYLKAKSEEEYLTERLTQETISYMSTRDKDKPFFAYLSYYNVHTPIQPFKKEFQKYKDRRSAMFGDTEVEPIRERDALTKARQDNPAYASMVEAVDQSVGRLMESLLELDLLDSTMIFFFSDNGGLSTKRTPGPTSNHPLRSGKGWLYEGGIREPMIVSGPLVKNKGTSNSSLITSTDFFPTILEMADIDLKPELHKDGRSFQSLVTEDGNHSRRTIYWHYPHYHGSNWRPGASVRQENWKLIEFYEYDQVELYDINQDIGEAKDLSKLHPEKTNELRMQLRDWQKRMNAKMPKPVSNN